MSITKTTMNYDKLPLAAAQYCEVSILACKWYCKCAKNYGFRLVLAVARDQGLQGVLPVLGIDHPREGIPTDEERKEQE
jgi:hypothetical protein